MDQLALLGSSTFSQARVAIGLAIGTLNWEVLLGANTVFGTCNFTVRDWPALLGFACTVGQALVVIGLAVGALNWVNVSRAVTATCKITSTVADQFALLGFCTLSQALVAIGLAVGTLNGDVLIGALTVSGTGRDRLALLGFACTVGQALVGIGLAVGTPNWVNDFGAATAGTVKDQLALCESCTFGHALVAIGLAVGTLNWDVLLGANTGSGTCNFTIGRDWLALRGSARTVGQALVVIGLAVGTPNWFKDFVAETAADFVAVVQNGEHKEQQGGDPGSTGCGGHLIVGLSSLRTASSDRPLAQFTHPDRH